MPLQLPFDIFWGSLLTLGWAFISSLLTVGPFIVWLEEWIASQLH